MKPRNRGPVYDTERFLRVLRRVEREWKRFLDTREEYLKYYGELRGTHGFSEGQVNDLFLMEKSGGNVLATAVAGLGLEKKECVQKYLKAYREHDPAYQAILKALGEVQKRAPGCLRTDEHPSNTTPITFLTDAIYYRDATNCIWTRAYHDVILRRPYDGDGFPPVTIPPSR